MNREFNYKNKYILTLELYYDTCHYTTPQDGHFFNVLIRYFDENSNITVGVRTASVGRIVSRIISSSVGQFGNQIGLVKYKISDLYKFDIIMPKFKNVKIHYSNHMAGTIYDIAYNNLIDILNDFKINFKMLQVEMDNDLNIIE